MFGSGKSLSIRSVLWGKNNGEICFVFVQSLEGGAPCCRVSRVIRDIKVSIAIFN